MANITETREMLKLDSVTLEVGHKIALFVDSKIPAKSPIGVTLKLRGGSQGPNEDSLLISGTGAQLNAVEHTLDLCQKAVIDGLYQPRLRTAINNNTLLSAEKKVA
jgi:hypothetical protein